MEMLYSKKVMNYLTDNIDNSSSEDHDISTYIVKRSKYLSKNIKQGILTPFVINKSNEYLFIIKK